MIPFLLKPDMIINLAQVVSFDRWKDKIVVALADGHMIDVTDEEAPQLWTFLTTWTRYQRDRNIASLADFIDPRPPIVPVP